jgi:outer membrane protein TolC
MNKNKPVLFVLIPLFTALTNLRLHAQEATLLTEVSPAYLDKLITLAKTNYPRVKINQNRIDIAKTAISRAKISWFDAVTVSYVYQPQNFTFNYAQPETSYFNGFQAGLFLNIGNLLQKPSLIKQAKLEYEVAGNERDEYFLTITAEVKKRYYTYVLRIAELKIHSKLVQDAETAVKDVRNRFQKGEETYDNYNKAQMTLSDHMSAKILTESNLFIAKSQLEEMIGQSLESVN